MILQKIKLVDIFVIRLYAECYLTHMITLLVTCCVRGCLIIWRLRAWMDSKDH